MSELLDGFSSFFDCRALAEYIRCISDPRTVYGICEDYRATFGVDLDMDTVDVKAPSDFPGSDLS